MDSRSGTRTQRIDLTGRGMRLPQYIKELWPAKKQYKAWSLPSKLGFISAYATLLSLLITGITLLVSLVINYKIDDIPLMQEWDEQIATQAALEHVSTNAELRIQLIGNPQDSHPAIPEHKIYGTFYLKHATKEVMLSLVVSKVSDAECHVCAPIVSVFEFTKLPKGWSMTGSYINAFKEGQWGEPYPMKAIEIGHDIFGIVVETDYMQHGITSTRTRIFSPFAGEMKEIFSARTGRDNSGYPSHDREGRPTAAAVLENWTTEITIDKSGSSFYDLLLKQVGTKAGGLAQEVYKFDGSKYSPSKVYQ